MILITVTEKSVSEMTTDNQKLWNIGSYVGAAGMLLHVNGKFTMGKFKIIIKLF
jgi:hypothetical protein